MTHIWRNRLGLAAGALVWCVGVAAHAAPADTTLHAHNTGHAHSHGDKPHHHPHKHGDKARGHHHHPASKHKYATPEQHERAAVNDERRRGKGPQNPGMAQGNAFERNALRRCDVFKTREDHEACVARVRSTGTGSVQGGGILREYVQTVPVHP